MLKETLPAISYLRNQKTGILELDPTEGSKLSIFFLQRAIISS